MEEDKLDPNRHYLPSQEALDEIDKFRLFPLCIKHNHTLDVWCGRYGSKIGELIFISLMKVIKNRFYDCNIFELRACSASRELEQGDFVRNINYQRGRDRLMCDFWFRANTAVVSIEEGGRSVMMTTMFIGVSYIDPKISDTREVIRRNITFRDLNNIGD